LCKDGLVAGRHDPEVQEQRLTYLAQERTLLAWWRAALTAFAVAVGVGRLLPALVHGPSRTFVALGVGFGLLGVAFVSFGAYRDRTVNRQLASGRFQPLGAHVVWIIAGALVLLGVATILLLILES
jgi:uncharacterized membrane protein YidH (DUF202 family)